MYILYKRISVTQAVTENILNRKIQRVLQSAIFSFLKIFPFFFSLHQPTCTDYLTLLCYLYITLCRMTPMTLMMDELFCWTLQAKHPICRCPLWSSTIIWIETMGKPSYHMTKYSQILDKKFRGPLWCRAKRPLLCQKIKSVYSIYWHDSMGDTVSALLDLDTESSIYQA